jgi:hypothetical protein
MVAAIKSESVAAFVGIRSQSAFHRYSPLVETFVWPFNQFRVGDEAAR